MQSYGIDLPNSKNSLFRYRHNWELLDLVNTLAGLRENPLVVKEAQYSAWKGSQKRNRIIYVGLAQIVSMSYVLLAA